MRLTWRRIEVELARSVGGRGHAATTRQSVLVELEDAGVRGVGEASPLPGYSPESLDDVEDALAVLARSWEGSSRRARPGVGGTLIDGDVPRGLPSLAFAIEAARLDLEGRRRGVPAWSLLGGSPDAVVGLSRLIDGASLAEVEAAAAAAAADGMAAIKLKLDGAAFSESVARALAARRGAPGLALRFDLNRTLPDAEVERLAELLPARPELVEEPCLSGALLGPRAPVPMAADESLADAGADLALTRALDEGRLVAIVLKPALLGGLARCLSLARRADAAGIFSVVTHMFDGPVARAACAALALALPRSLAAGLDAHASLAPWPAAPCAFIEQDRLIATAAPGLGFA